MGSGGFGKEEGKGEALEGEGKREGEEYWMEKRNIGRER